MLSMFLGMIVGAGAMAILLTFDKQDNNLLSVFMVCMGEGERAAHSSRNIDEVTAGLPEVRARAVRFGYHWAMERRR